MATFPTQSQGFIQRTLTKLQNQAFASRRATELNSQSIIHVEPLYTELTRAGRHFKGGLKTLTGLAPVQSIRTTTCDVFLFNGEGTGGRNYYVTRLGWACVAATAAAAGSLWGIMSKPTATLPTQGSNYTVNNCSPSSNQKSNAILAESYTIPTIDTAGVTSWKAWIPLQFSLQVAGVSTGQGDANAVFQDGQIIIPPGWGMGFFFLSGAGTNPLFGIDVQWVEIENTLE